MLNSAGSKNATSRKVLGVINETPARTKKATVPLARHRAVSRPMSSRMPSTFWAVFIPSAAIRAISRAEKPR